MFNKSKLKSVVISGREVFPIIEGGKGIGVSNGTSSGAFAQAGAVGTFSGVNADRYDAQGNYKEPVYQTTTRRERHNELIEMSIEGGITQAKIAHEQSNGEGRIHVNILWEMGGAQRILHGLLEGAKGMIHGVTCGAGMPYKVAEISEHYGIHYYPIVSSMRAFRALWKRSYHKHSALLGGVVYEDPWLAGGHNGLSNSEDPNAPEDPYPRVAELRKFMNEVGLQHVPVVMAGGVWYLREWEHWLDNPEIGPVAFQFGTRPIVTKESPVSEAWKRKLLSLKEGDVFLNRYSPTGFYSSGVYNQFIKDIEGRHKRQVAYASVPEGNLTEVIPFGPRKRPIYVTTGSQALAEEWISQGYNELMKTPESTVIFVKPEEAASIIKDQVDCMGCLSACKFSNWSDHLENYTTGQKADPRSFCIQKTLQDIIHSDDTENQLMFAGHNAYQFGKDPFYSNGFVPTVKELVDRIMTGD
ncbi:MAG: nitronate monooxygenase [Rickettsiales bacterium]|nr:nitronate monooxygenase [Rickettsiales bacterium]